eukprot:9132168-Alexandrium_andersonii.AAC.1
MRAGHERACAQDGDRLSSAGTPARTQVRWHMCCVSAGLGCAGTCAGALAGQASTCASASAPEAP